MSDAADKPIEQGLGSRADRVLQNIRIGGGIVGAAVTIGFFAKEVQRILALPIQLANILYLVLLLWVFLLIGSWFLCALRHVEQMQIWSDPVNYQPPDEVIRIVTFAAVFIASIYAARQILVFALVYTIYGVLNMFTMNHLRAETAEVLRKTREGFEDGDASLGLREQALIALEAYFLQLLGRRRALLTLLGAICGLAVAVYGAVMKSAKADETAYFVFILLIAIPEVLLSWHWRSVLAKQLRPCEAALFELNRKARAKGSGA